MSAAAMRGAARTACASRPARRRRSPLCLAKKKGGFGTAKTGFGRMKQVRNAHARGAAVPAAGRDMRITAGTYEGPFGRLYVHGGEEACDCAGKARRGLAEWTRLLSRARFCSGFRQREGGTRDV